MFIIAIGIEILPLLKYSYISLSLTLARAFNTQRETASIAFAPKKDLFLVPSNSINKLSIAL